MRIYVCKYINIIITYDHIYILNYITKIIPNNNKTDNDECRVCYGVIIRAKLENGHRAVMYKECACIDYIIRRD